MPTIEVAVVPVDRMYFGMMGRIVPAGTAGSTTGLVSLSAVMEMSPAPPT